MTIIAAPRLILRPPSASDAPAIIRGLNNLAVSRWTRRIPHPYTCADAEAWLALPSESEGILKRAISLGGELIGVIGLENREIGYWIAEPHWGKGYATQAARAMADHAFERIMLDGLAASYRQGNAASRRILLGLGFIETGPARSACLAARSEVGIMTLELSRLHWRNAKERRR